MSMDILDDASLGGRNYEAPSALLEREEGDVMLPPSRLRRSARRHWREPLLNITSFVDVLSVLLFFLLSVATLEKLGAHDVNLPRQTEEFARESDLEIKNLALSLSKDRLTLRGLLTPRGKEPDVLRVEIPVAGEVYDLERLRQELLRIKASYRTDGAIILMVADDVNYGAIVKIMDTVRERVEHQDGRRRIVSLFPEISLSDYLLEAEA